MVLVFWPQVFNLKQITKFCCLLILSSHANIATAEQTNTQTYIEELTVLGERDKETLKDESHSVAKFSNEDLKLATQFTFEDLYERIPNVTNNNRNEPVVRGVSQFGIDTGLRGAASATNFYRDGLGGIVPPVLWDVLTAEVSRGPQSELRPSVGGLLAIGTTDPSDEFTGRARVSWVPNAEDREVGLAVGGPFLSNWSARLSLYSREDKGHTENVFQSDDEWDRFEEELARLKFLWKPEGSPGTTIKLIAEDVNRERGGGTEVRGSNADPQFNPFDRKASLDAAARSHQQSTSAAIEINHDFGNPWMLDFAFGGVKVDDDSIVDGDGTPLPQSLIRTKSSIDAIGFVFLSYYRGDDWLIRFRQRATRFDSNFDQDNIAPFDLDGLGPIPGIQTNVQVLLPWENFYDWTTQLTLSRNFDQFRFAGSLTYEGDTRGGDVLITSSSLTRFGIPQLDQAYDATVQGFFPQITSDKDTRSSDLLAMLSFSWNVTERTILGIKWEQARRAAGVSVNLARSTATEYDREKVDNIDLFLRATGFNDRLSVSSNLFYTDAEDLQFSAILTTTPLDNQIENAQQAKTAGLELELAWLDGPWNAFLAAGLLHTKLEKVETGLTNLSGNRYPFAPDWSLVLGANYDPGQGAFFAVEYSAQAEAYGTIDNRRGNRSESRHLLNARFGWNWHKTRLSFYGRNLLDDKYHSYRDLDLPAGINQVFQPGDPLEFGISLDYSW